MKPAVSMIPRAPVTSATVKENVGPNATKMTTEANSSKPATKPGLSTVTTNRVTVKRATAPILSTSTAASSTLKKTTSSSGLAPPSGLSAKRTTPGVTRPNPSTTLPPSKRPKTTTPVQSIESRMKEVEELSATLKAQVELLNTQLGDREVQLEQVVQVKSSLMQDVTTYSKEVEESHTRNRELMKLLEETEMRTKVEIDMLQNKLMIAQSRVESTELSLRTLRGEAARMQATIINQTEEIETLKTNLMTTQTSLTKSEDLATTRKRKIDDLEETIEGLKEQIAELEAKSRDDEDTRRKLHNTIQELKGNIRVFCRVRPGGDSSDDSVKYIFPKLDDGALEITQKMSKDVTGCKNAPDKKHNFHFDKVFPPNTNQETVFVEISQLVQSALDGYNACIFAYGQTGSGKTYTMEGPEPEYLCAETEGMISRAVRQIFISSEKLREKGWEYEMRVSFLEIYNESIRDLLDPKNADTKKCEIKHDPETGVTSVSNQIVCMVRTPDRVAELLAIASKNRAVGSTRVNERSSRSHSVFQLKMTGKNTVTGTTVEGILNLIDLAGSERVSSSGATGDRLNETKNINKSLSCLGDVISALANKEKHIPYRNSKLTYLLQNSLGGNSKTLMFVNISPAAENLNETVNSLRFASKVNACEIGTARKGGKVDLLS